MRRVLIVLFLLIPCVCFARVSGGGVTTANVMIQEEDGDPSGKLNKLRVTNASLTKNAEGDYSLDTGASGGGAPTDADYLVGTANATLSAEIVVGTTPGGELGGTWASPTVDSGIHDDEYLMLDQTTPQDISGGQPDFLAGLRAGSTNQLSIDASGNLTTTGTIGTAATTTFDGINVTSGADPGHTHTGASLSGIDISADTNLAGGSGITLSDDTLDLDINSLDVATIVSGDFVPFWDITATATNKKTTFANFEAALSHDNLISGTIADHDTTATGANLTTLTDDSMADALHRHSELSSSDGSNTGVLVSAAGNLSIRPEADGAGAFTVNSAGNALRFRVDTTGGDTTLILRNASDVYTVGLLSNGISYINGGGLSVGGTGTLSLNGTAPTINTGTTDGSDNKRMQIAGGGTTSITRGAYFNLNGNEYATDPGWVKIGAGNVSGANGSIVFQTSGADNVTIARGGVTTFSNKIALTQVDGNEYIDSLNDGFMDYGATTQHRFNNSVLITQAASGQTAHTSADDLVLDNSGDSALSILSGNANTGALVFGDTNDNWVGSITYTHNVNSLSFATNDTGYRLTIDSSGNIIVASPTVAEGSAVLEVGGGAIFKDKVKFTQTDGNEYIDSLADGYVDIGATTSVRINTLLNLVPINADPGTLTDGDVWYRGDTDEYRVRANGVTKVLLTATP